MHTLRHTAAMRLLLAGNDVTVIALLEVSRDAHALHEGNTPGTRPRPHQRNLALRRWAGQDLNLRATDYESAALTTELPARDQHYSTESTL
jgi:hypothetical protein